MPSAVVNDVVGANEETSQNIERKSDQPVIDSVQQTSGILYTFIIIYCSWYIRMVFFFAKIDKNQIK